MRPVEITTGFLQTAEGSALITVGNTRVLCAATVEDSVPQFLRGSGKGWVTAEYSMLPRATTKRTPREVNKGRPSGRTHEIQRLIGRSLRAVVDLRSWASAPSHSIATWSRPMAARAPHPSPAPSWRWRWRCSRCVKYGMLKRLPLIDYVAATSVGILAGEPMLDLCYEEDSQAAVDMNVVMTGAGKFVEVQATAERHAFDDEQMARMMRLARARHRRAGGDSEAGGPYRVTVYCATGNPGKLREFRLAAELAGIQVETGARPCRRWSRAKKPATTFEANAILKAEYYGAARSGACCSPTIPAWKWMPWAARPASIRRDSRAPALPTKPTIACCWKGCAA